MTELNKRLVQLYARARQAHHDMLETISWADTEGRQMQAGPIVDAVFMLKRTREFHEQIRKDIDRGLEALQKYGCLVAMQTDDNKLQGEIARGFGDSRQQPLIPTREADPVAYSRLMESLGVPVELMESGVVKPSWSGCEELVSRLASEGKPIPDGLGQLRMVPKFTVNARATKGVDIDELANAALGIGVNGASPVSGPEEVPF